MESWYVPDPSGIVYLSLEIPSTTSKLAFHMFLYMWYPHHIIYFKWMHHFVHLYTYPSKITINYLRHWASIQILSIIHWKSQYPLKLPWSDFELNIYLAVECRILMQENFDIYVYYYPTISQCFMTTFTVILITTDCGFVSTV